MAPPKKKNTKAIKVETSDPVLLHAFIYFSARSESFAPRLLPVSVDAAIPKACPGVKDKLSIFNAI